MFRLTKKLMADMEFCRLRLRHQGRKREKVRRRWVIWARPRDWALRFYTNTLGIEHDILVILSKA